MDAYIIPIKTALLIFPIIAIIITFPYMIIQYRKYGAISFLRTTILYSFILYLLCMYMLVILPLPSIKEVISSNRPTVQLIPFQFIIDFLNETKLVISDPSTYLSALKQNCFLQVFFNILLFVPFGIYLKYYFRISLKKIFLFSFLLSLFFEFTQLSGLYGIYPRSYRLFDVDDLLLNTTGGLLGVPIAVFVMRFLPTRETIDKNAYEKGHVVSFLRRGVAFCIDLVIISIVSIFCTLPIAFIIYTISLYLSKGYTVGKKILHIQIIDQNQNSLTFYQCFLRSSMLFVSILFLPFIFLPLFIIDIICRNQKNHTLFYERLSKTICISTISDHTIYFNLIKNYKISYK